MPVLQPWPSQLLQVLGGDPMSDKTRVFSLVSGGLQLDLSIKGALPGLWQQLPRRNKLKLSRLAGHGFLQLPTQ